jgi:hypothetical protein
MAEFGLDWLSRTGPSPYAFEPEDKGTRLNRTDTVVNGYTCASLGKKGDKFYEKLQSYRYPETLNLNQDEKKGYYFYPQPVNRLVTLHCKYVPEPQRIDHATWNYQYLKSCQEQECLPSPEASLRIIRHSLLLLVTQTIVHRKQRAVSEMPYSYYTAYMKDRELQFFQPEPEGNLTEMVHFVVLFLGCISDYVLHSFIPQKYLGDLKEGKECVRLDGAWIRFVPENITLAVMQLFQFLFNNLGQLDIPIQGPKKNRRRTTIYKKFTDVHRPAFDRIYNLTAFWASVHNLPHNTGASLPLDTRGDAYVDLLVTYGPNASKKQQNRRSLPVMNSLTIRLSRRFDTFRVIYTDGLFCQTPPLMAPILPAEPPANALVVAENQAAGTATNNAQSADSVATSATTPTEVTPNEATTNATTSQALVPVTNSNSDIASPLKAVVTTPDYFSLAIIPSSHANPLPSSSTLLKQGAYDPDTLPGILNELSAQLKEFSRVFQLRSEASAKALTATPAPNEDEEAAPRLKKDRADLPLDASKGRMWCQFWHDRGRCNFGSKCKFYHPPSLAAPQLLEYDFAVRSSQIGCVGVVRASVQKATKDLRRQRELDFREKVREEMESEAKLKERLNAEVFKMKHDDHGPLARETDSVPQINTVILPPPSLVNEIELKQQAPENDLPEDGTGQEQRVEEEEMADEEDDYADEASAEKAVDDRFTASRLNEEDILAVAALQRKIRYASVRLSVFYF